MRFFADPKHGPLPALLLVLTFVSGIADAVSVVALGRVFVANMTGNVVFIAFAAIRVAGFSLRASLSALAGFLVGAQVAGRLIARQTNRSSLLRDTVLVEVAMFAVAFVIMATVRPLIPFARDTAVFALSLGMGAQNAAARRLAVPDITTSVLTMTLTGLFAELPGSRADVVLRRVVVVVSLFAGAAAGAFTVLHTALATGVGIALALLLAVFVAATLVSRRPAGWHGSA